MQKRTARTIRLVALGLLIALILLLALPASHLITTAIHDRNTIAPPPRGYADDASRLNRTAVREIWRVPSDSAAGERQLQELIGRAGREGLKVSIAGAKHTMGGHTIYPGGIVVDMLPFKAMSLGDDGILHVQAGARWLEIIPFLDRRGRSVAVMQSDNAFSVGGSLSANVHGWQHDRPPISSSVLGFRLLRADGSIVRCSRTENPELFALALGGYGLFGVILDVDLQTVPNERYRMERHIIPSDRYVETFNAKVDDTTAGMVYGRLNVTRENFLGEAILTIYRRAPSPDGTLPPLEDPEVNGLARLVFRGSVGSDYGKRLRWQAEKELGEKLGGRYFSRNQLLNSPVEGYLNHDSGRTDILQEYFIPPESVGAFLAEARRIIPRHGADLLNVTIRNVYSDRESLLRYADTNVFAFVMFFNQPRTQQGDSAMIPLTRELIDAALLLGGSYYLPYRLQATDEQFHRAYPEARRFFELKRQYDPQELFQNQFYLRYGGGGGEAAGHRRSAR